MKKNKTRIIATVLAASSLLTFGLTSCEEEKKPTTDSVSNTGWRDEKVYTMNDYTGQMPDTWNELTTSDGTNRDLAAFLNSAFFEYDYKFDENGEPLPGEFTVKYSAATKLEDVTSRYLNQYGLTQEDVDEGHHAFAITLRKDLKWDDGTAIKAEDFVYTMEQQMSPNYLFSTASNYYSGNYIVHNAKEFLYQGQSGYFAAKTAYSEYSEDLDDKLIFSFGNTTENKEKYDKATSYIREAMGFPDSYTASAVAKYFITYYAMPVTAEQAAALEGKTLKEIKNDATLKASWDAIIGWWQSEPNEELDFFVADYTFPKMDFSEVGFFVGENEYELVIVIDNTLNPLDENGNLAYEAGYYLSSFPLVKKSLWEKCADKTRTPWTNTYCSVSVANSASWGPYKLTNYEADSTYTLSRNDNWYGYGMDLYEGQYQTDNVVCRKITEWSAAWQLFQKGQVDGVSMDVSIINQYRNSSRAYFTPDTYTFDLNLLSSANSHTKDRNNLLLNYTSFRKAVSLCFDRDNYCATNSPSSQGALGLLNSMYYYDVENGGVYRNSEQAKEAILNTYGAEKVEGGWKVGTKVYADIDDALDATTGYNLTLAKELVTQAYNEAKAAGDYVDGEDIVLLYGIESESENITRIKNWFQNSFDKMTEGTPLQGKIKIEYYYFDSATWSEDFEDGKYDLCFGAWGQAAFNPWYLLGETQISADNRYALGWDPSDVNLTITLKGDETHKGGEHTFTLLEWNSNMQGKSDAKLNCALYPMEDRLTILAAVEEAVLSAYYTIPVYSRSTAALKSYKCDYITYDYNTFMGYGGIRYMTYNYDDIGWEAFVASQGGTLNYLQ